MVGSRTEIFLSGSVRTGEPAIADGIARQLDVARAVAGHVATVHVIAANLAIFLARHIAEGSMIAGERALWSGMHGALAHIFAAKFAVLAAV